MHIRLCYQNTGHRNHPMFMKIDTEVFTDPRTNPTKYDENRRRVFLSNLHKLRPLDLFSPTLRRNGSDLDIAPVYMYGMIWSFNFHRPNILYPFFMNLGLSLFTYSTNRYRFSILQSAHKAFGFITSIRSKSIYQSEQPLDNLAAKSLAISKKVKVKQNVVLET